VRRISRIRSKPGPRKKWGPVLRAVKFEMPPERARLVSYNFLKEDGTIASTRADAAMTRWVYKKGSKLYTIIVEHVVIARYTPSDWREGRVRVVQVK